MAVRCRVILKTVWTKVMSRVLAQRIMAVGFRTRPLVIRQQRLDAGDAFFQCCRVA